MRILHIHPSMQGGGIEAMICALANAMSAEADVAVCSIFEPKDDAIFWNKLSTRVNKFSLEKKREGFSLVEVYRIYMLYRNGGFDIVHLHGFIYYHILAIILLRNKIKFYYTVHSDAYKENSRWDRVILTLKKLCFRKLWVRPITISANSQKSFKDLYKCDSRLIYNGVPKPKLGNIDVVSKYKISEVTKVFVHAGRIDTPKNQLVLCRVFSELIKQGYDIVLLIAGRIQNEEIFHNIKPYFSERIVYLGERSDIPQLMSQCVAMCLPSIWEGMPVTLLESLSVGCIPICSPVGGIPNVITQKRNGLLAESYDFNDYLEVMQTFLSISEEDYNRMRMECVLSFKPFDIENIANEYMNYYRE